MFRIAQRIAATALGLAAIAAAARQHQQDAAPPLHQVAVGNGVVLHYVEMGQGSGERSYPFLG